MIHFSTDYVFDGSKDAPYLEEDDCAPVSVYGKTKRAGEQIIVDNMDDYIILRISWLFSKKGKSFVQTICRLLKEKPYLNVVSDQYGSPTAVDSVVEVVEKIIVEHPYLKGIFHYANYPTTTWYDFANEIQNNLVEHHGVEKKEIRPITSKEFGAKAKRPKYSALDSSKLLSILGLSPVDWKTQLDFLKNIDV
jgi:dTDP-4-dehydrorhamnose reductase